MSLPTKAKVVIIGGGIHGLSTAWKLSETYKNPCDIIVLEKKDTAAGASGIACGVVRNNYFQPAMRELMAHSVSVWESDPKAFKYNPVGYLQISPEGMHEDVASLYEQDKVHHVGRFPELESQMVSYTGERSKPSPDRLDALVWGLSELSKSKGQISWRIS